MKALIIFSFSILITQSLYGSGEGSSKLLELGYSVPLNKMVIHEFNFKTVAEITVKDKEWLSFSDNQTHCKFSRKTESSKVVLKAQTEWKLVPNTFVQSEDSIRFDFRNSNNVTISLECKLSLNEYFFSDSSYHPSEKFENAKRRCSKNNGDFISWFDTNRGFLVKVKDSAHYKCKVKPPTYGNLSNIFRKLGIEIKITEDTEVEYLGLKPSPAKTKRPSLKSKISQ